MQGLEELMKNGHVDPSDVSTLRPIAWGEGSLGKVSIGATTFAVLTNYFDLRLDDVDVFVPIVWKKPSDIRLAQPDELLVRGSKVEVVVEYKSPGELRQKKIREAALEQLHCYCLAAGAGIGFLSDGKHHYWIHNLDPARKVTVKQISEGGSLYTKQLTEASLNYVLRSLNIEADDLIVPEKINPETVARSVWQSIYVATRESPERCFQTFVELFTYKLLSDSELLPTNYRIQELVGPSRKFAADNGRTQISFYLDLVREHIKASLFPPATAPAALQDVTLNNASYPVTRGMIANSSNEDFSADSVTSVLDGHAFQKNADAYNEAFVSILRRLHRVGPVQQLDPSFKSRVYEQFLRRDPNTTKVSGKYFTPRNVVRAIVDLAQVTSLPKGSSICDPACGVGGFLTETVLALEKNGVRFLQEPKPGRLEVSHKLLGLEVEYEVSCLAKSNLFLHTLEAFKSQSPAGRKAYNKLLSDVVIWCQKDGELGALNHPAAAAFDLIMANPPYMVSGTGAVSKKLKASKALEQVYSAGGSGLEARFVNWIVHALKPGGRAFVVLPKAFLARVETGIKEYIRAQCIVDAVVYLPANSFYTTPVETYILCITRKLDEQQQQVDPVFTYLISEIGETRDVARAPAENDLPEMVEEFRGFCAKKNGYTPKTIQAKVVDVAHLAPTRRWDLDHLWSESDKRLLGVVDREQLTVEEVVNKLTDAVEVLKESSAIAQPASTAGQHRDLSLSDSEFFKIHRGKRITKHDVKSNPGDIVVIASGRHKESIFGGISAEYLLTKFGKERLDDLPWYFTRERRLVSVGATGSVGVVHVRDEEAWFLHDDALAVEVLDARIDLNYFRYALQRAIARNQFAYTAKLYQERLATLSVTMPTDARGELDLLAQKAEATALARQELVRRTVFRTVQDLMATDVVF